MCKCESCDNYRIAPKPERTLVEMLRSVDDLWQWNDLRELCRRAASEIVKLEHGYRLCDINAYTTDELLAEIARRVK